MVHEYVYVIEQHALVPSRTPFEMIIYFENITCGCGGTEDEVRKNLVVLNCKSSECRTIVDIDEVWLCVLQHVKRIALRDLGAKTADVLCEVGTYLTQSVKDESTFHKSVDLYIVCVRKCLTGHQFVFLYG